jgi:hypothetical protein
VLYRASKHVPEFYSAALTIDPIKQRDAGYELERRALQLTNEVQYGGHWEATFTAAQCNGWLAIDLEEKFPDLLPLEVSDPRVAIMPEEIRVACRYKTSKVDTVISLACSVAMTEEPNVIAVRVLRARAGALPIPLSQFLDEVTSAAAETNLDVRWSQIDGDPVALVRLPLEHTDFPDRTLHLESIQLRDGAAMLSGRTEWKPIKPRK